MSGGNRANRLIAGILFFGIAAIAFPRAATADGVTWTAAHCERTYAQAMQREKAGKLENAFRLLLNADEEVGFEVGGDLPGALMKDVDDGPNPVYNEALAAARRIAGKLADQDFKRGDHGLGQRRHERIHDYAGADRIMQERIKRKELSVEDAIHTLVERGGLLKEGPNPYHYTADAKSLQPFADVLFKEVAAGLAQEEKLFSRRQKGVGKDGQKGVMEYAQAAGGPELLTELLKKNDILRSSEAVEVFGKNATAEKNFVSIRALAAARGDALFPSDDPDDLGITVRYYRVKPDNAKEKKAREKAERLGDAAMKKPDYHKAITYYKAAENEKKMEEAASQYEAFMGDTIKNRKAKDGGKKTGTAVKEMKKGEDEKQKFRKEQDDMEKELGF